MFQYRIVLLVGLAGFISAADNWVASLLLPSIAVDLAISVAQASVILTAYLIPYGILQPLYGYYADRYGRERILKGLLLGLSLATLSCALASDLLWLTVFRFITGLFAAGIITVSLGILGQHYSATQLTRAVGLFIGLTFLGQGLSAGLGGLLLNLVAWRAIFAAFALFSLLVWGLSFGLPSASGGSVQQCSLTTAIGQLLSCSSLRRVYLMALINGLVVLSGYSFVGAYLNIHFRLGFTAAGIGLMLFGLACCLTGLLNRWLLRSRLATMLLPLGLACSLAALLLLTSGCLGSAYTAIGLLGAGYVLVQSVLASRALMLAEEHKGLSSGLVGVGVFSGGGLGTWLGSLVLPRFGYAGIYGCLAVVALLALLVNLVGAWQKRAERAAVLEAD